MTEAVALSISLKTLGNIKKQAVKTRVIDGQIG